jgi:hypothetical protein
MDKPVRFFINTEQLPGEVTGRLVAMGKQLLTRFDFMREAGGVGDVWTQRTNDGIVFKLDKSGDVDNVKIYMPFNLIKPKEEKKKKELEIRELVFFVWLTEPDPNGSYFGGPDPSCIKLWNATLDVGGKTITPDNISDFFPDTESTYEGDNTGCSPEGGGKYFYPQLKWKDNEELEELVNISDTQYEDDTIYLDAWYVGLNQSIVYTSDYTWNQDPADFPAKPAWTYKNTDSYSYTVPWGFDDEAGGHALLYPANPMYQLEAISEYVTDYILDILRYRTDIEDYEINDHIVSGENIYTNKNNARHDWFRDTVATGFYNFGMKSAYAEEYNKHQTYVSSGDQTEVRGSCVCREYEKYDDASCYVYMFQKSIAAISIVDQHTLQYVASDSSGDTKTTTINNPLEYTADSSKEFWIRINDPYDGKREYYIDKFDNYISLVSSIYDYGGYPLYTYMIRDTYRDKIWFGYIYRDNHVVSEKFDMTDMYMCDFYGSAENNLYAGKFYWEHLHAAIKISKMELKEY